MHRAERPHRAEVCEQRHVVVGILPEKDRPSKSKPLRCALPRNVTGNPGAAWNNSFSDSVFHSRPGI